MFDLYWQGDHHALHNDVAAALQALDAPVFFVRGQHGLMQVATTGHLTAEQNHHSVLAYALAQSPAQFGSGDFQRTYNVRYAYMTGAMANGIASAEMVIALGQQGLLSSFGAAGLIPAHIEAAIHQIKAALPDGPYAFNLIHNPSEDVIERRGVELFLQHDIRVVEASAFLELTANIVYYRVAGLTQNQYGQIVAQNKVIAKVSRREVATQFMQPAPARLLQQLLDQNLITEQQANLAAHVPMADDITVEADSGGHTDNRPLVSLLPSIIALRDEIQDKYQYPATIRVGAAGGIGTPSAVLGAFMMGAAYVVTGSVNQACVEAGTSAHSKRLLAQADMADVIMAPAADMFESGIKVQVLKRGTFFPMRGQKLYELYRTYPSMEAIPAEEREKLEKQIFRRPLSQVWQDTEAYFQQRDPELVERVRHDPKAQMGLTFRWYLGLSSRWSNSGEKGREMDYQIWCGPAMGAFNDWVRGSYLEQPENRRVVDVAEHLMRGAAFLYRVEALKNQGIELSHEYRRYELKPLEPETLMTA